jgi:resuscitation-promoting factor RpfB
MVLVLPGMEVPEHEAPAFSLWIAEYAVAAGTAAWIDDGLGGRELVPWAMDLQEWETLNDCESNDWHLDSRYDGGLQFDPPTWLAYGGGEFAPFAFQASIAEQIEVGRRVRTAAGWGQWPGCTSRFGWRWGPQPNDWN